MNCSHLKSSIAKKQIVAVTGLMLIGFILGHLMGNLFIFAGPEAFNGYAEKLEHLRPGLYLIEVVLLFVFFVHMILTAHLVSQSIKARPVGYCVKKSSAQRSWATRFMPFTGTIIVVFVIWHLVDFTFIDHHGPRSILADGKSYEVYGVVYNSFTDPIHSLLYIIAMIALGSHLSHALQSFMQTFGFYHQRTLLVKNISNALGLFVAMVFSSIPVYVMYHFINSY